MTERPVTSLERLRESVAMRVEATSLRSVARQVGMSPSGLEKFLSGGMPYARSRQKLQDWWTREGQQPRSDLTAEGVEISLSALVRDLAPERREEGLETLMHTLRGLYVRQGDPFPPWLGDLAVRWWPDEDRPPDPEGGADFGR